MHLKITRINYLEVSMCYERDWKPQVHNGFYDHLKIATKRS